MSNRYVTEGIIRDAVEGKHVLFIADRLNESTEALRVAALHPAVEKVCRVNGRESVTFKTGGVIKATSPRSMRGQGADVVVIGREYADHVETYQDAVMCLNKRIGSELIRL